MKKNYKTNLIPFSHPLIDVSTGLLNIKKSLVDDFPNEGNLNSKFETKIAKLLNVKYVITTTSGTTALYLALKSLGIGYGDEVIVPNITFPATVNAVIMSGAKPVIVDVRREDLLIEPTDIKKIINSKTRAIIPVHISGRGSNIFELKDLAQKKGIFLVEDAAEALFSGIKNQKYGTIGDVGCFSLAPNKIITSGQGGLIVTNNKKLNNKIRLLKDQGRKNKVFGGNDNFYKEGYNFKFTDLQAGLGLSQLSNINFRIKKLEYIYNYYLKNIKQSKNFKIFNFKKNEIALWTDAFCTKRDELFGYLYTKKIICRKFWLPLSFSKKQYAFKSNFDISQSIHKNLIWLPASLNLNDKQLRKICREINNFNTYYY